jgi:hypothetical protein
MSSAAWNQLPATGLDLKLELEMGDFFRVVGVLMAAVLASCGLNRERLVEVTEEADAGGVEIVATSEMRNDSIRVAARITNKLDTTADLILHGSCPVTVIAYSEDRLLWDERDGQICEDSELPVPLAPGEVEMLSHSISDSGIRALGESEEYNLGVRVRTATGPEYVLAAPLRE